MMTDPVEDNALAIENALSIAIEMHRGQRDSDGAAYILHLIRVMMRCNSPQARIAGLLHDILEDTSASADDLVSRGIPENVIQTIQKLTHRPEVSYQQYIEALVEDPVAVEVKLADLEDNYSIGRVKYRNEHREHDANRLQRYVLTYRFLQGQLELQAYRDSMQQLENT